MDELTPEAFDSPLPADVQRPCPDCNGPAMWLDTPRVNGSHLEVAHQWGCPGTWGRRLEESGRRPGAIVCDDCGGPAVWLDTPAPNGSHKVLVHEYRCPGFAARPNADRSEDSREGNTP